MQATNLHQAHLALLADFANAYAAVASKARYVDVFARESKPARPRRNRERSPQPPFRASDIARVARLMTEQQAAEYVGIPISQFRYWVACSRLPQPLLDSELYDLRAIDAALDKLSGIGGAANALDAWRLTRKAEGGGK